MLDSIHCIIARITILIWRASVGHVPHGDQGEAGMKDIASLHRAEYDAPPDIIAAAPGVVKFLGEQTDVSDALVLASSISFELRVGVSPRRDSSLRFLAADFGERKRATVGNLKYKREDRWANYPKAVYELMVREGLVSKGVNFTISGDIPIGLGLASSSALGLASALALKELFGLNFKNEALAEFARRAESEFMEKPVPPHDYFSATAPGAGTISIVDVKNSRRRALPFLSDDWAIVLTDSKVPRMSVDAELALRNDECKRCFSIISENGRRSLRDVNVDELDDLMGLLPESVRRRCLHVVEELSRVKEAEEALIKGDAPAFGRVINKSHASLRNLFEVSCPEIDWLAKRAMEIEGVLCSRLTGKGFGGCTVSVMKPQAIPEYRKRLEDYERIFGFRPVIYETRVSGGMRITE